MAFVPYRKQLFTIVIRRSGCTQCVHDLIIIDHLIRSLRLILKDLKKSLTNVKSGDFSIMHNNNVIPRYKMFPDWPQTHGTEQGFRKIKMYTHSPPKTIGRKNVCPSKSGIVK